MRLWAATDEPTQKQELDRRIRKLLAGIRRHTVVDHDLRWGACRFLPGDVFDNGKVSVSFSPMAAGQILEPLVLYWVDSGDATMREFADQVAAGIVSGREANRHPKNPDDYRFGPDGRFTGHFHNKSSIVLGVARHGAALLTHGQPERGRELLRFAKQAYDWTLLPTNLNRGSTFGWFPERAGCAPRLRTSMEICCTADMIQLAATLASASEQDPSLAEFDALWDHVERYTLNTVVASQFRITPRYRDMVERGGGDLAVARDLEGAWAGYHPPNDWVTFKRLHPHYPAMKAPDGESYEMLMGSCCNYAGVRALHACWNATLAEDDRVARVRLPLSRQGDTLEQSVTEGPTQVTQTIRMKKTRELSVRVPDWADPSQVVVVPDDAGKASPQPRGRWLGPGAVSRRARGSR